MARASNQAPASFTSSKSNRLSGAGEFEPEPPDGEAFVPEAPAPAALSEPLAFTLSPGEEKCFELEPDRGFDIALLRDKRGERLPWYVWITYDGDARAFARVHANPEGLSAP